VINRSPPKKVDNLVVRIAVEGQIESIQEAMPSPLIAEARSPALSSLKSSRLDLPQTDDPRGACGGV
jgi:hypothetical protein